MSAPITTAFGNAVPPAPRHAVTAHMGTTWDVVEQFAADSASVVAKFANTYPRSRPHRDIVQLADAVLGMIGHVDRTCFLFSSLQSARQCVEYATSPKRDDGKLKKPLDPADITIRAFKAKDSFLAVIFPAEKRPVVAGFWSTTGTGISSRFAESNLAHLDQLKEIPLSELNTERHAFQGEAHRILRERIVFYQKRSPIEVNRRQTVTPDDVYLFQSGMASIYKPHTYMLDLYQGASVLFGMAFMDTLVTLEQFGPGSRFFGLGTDDELEALEEYLKESRACGRKVQAIWVEFPANPLLVSPDIGRLRELADEYDVILGIDDTIGSWANIDVLHVADILATSITKSFNGYADAICGSVVLNPLSGKYQELKALFDANYVPELYVDDAEVIERNSRDYLTRTAKLNANAAAVVEFLQSEANDPDSVVHRVHHPSVNPSGANYKRYMRPATADFQPGYGGVFSVELADAASTRAFYDNLHVHKSVHLGAPFTLAFAYPKCAYGQRLDWAAQYGLKPTQIRVSVGLEDADLLVRTFRGAVEAANKHRGAHLLAA